MSWGRQFLFSLQFLTVLPVGKNIPREKVDFSQAMAFFPLVGSLIGTILVLISLTVSHFFSPWLCSLIVLVVWILLTGAIHLDGLTDSIDGLSGGTTKEETLRIMKDSHCGAKGLVALFLILLLKFILLREVNLHWEALFFAPMISRWSMVLAASLAPYAGKGETLGRKWIEGVSFKEIAYASLIIALAMILLAQVIYLYILILVVGITFIWMKYLQQRLGGITGDTLGALNEITEVAAFLPWAFLF